jgi:hypothetical protein
MARLLTQFRDARLTGHCLDAFVLPFVPGGSEEWRNALRARLTDLLPQYAYTDATPLNAHQRGVLLQMVRRHARKLRRQQELSDEETRFLVATLNALAWEALRPERQEKRPDRREERAVKQISEAATQSPDALRIANLREVGQAAEDCLLRLRA